MLNLPAAQPPTGNADDLELSVTAKLELRDPNPPPLRCVRTVAAATAQDLPTGPSALTDCSSLKQAVTHTTWILHFCRNLRRRPEDRKMDPLSPDKRREALHLWIRLVQHETYTAKLGALQRGTPLPP